MITSPQFKTENRPHYMFTQTRQMSEPSQCYPIDLQQPQGLSQVPYSYPAYDPTMIANVLFQAEQAGYLRGQQNQFLQSQLDKKIWKAEALSELYEIQGNAYYGKLANGVPRKVTNFVFKSVTVVSFDDMFGRKEDVLILLSGGQPDVIQWDKFLDDKELIFFLESLSGTGIEQYASQKKTAWLLRSIAAQIKKSIHIPFFGGWQTSQRNRQLYFTFPEFRTSGEIDEPICYEKVHDTVSGTAGAEARRYIASLMGIRSKDLRTICALWLHASFLTTLLREQEAIPSKVLTFSDLNPFQEKYLRSIFCVCKDTTLSLAALPGSFAFSLASAKDRPLLITDSSDNINRRENCSLLRQILACGDVSVKLGKKNNTIPLSTLPVLVSRRDSSLLGLSCSISIEITADDFDYDFAIGRDIAGNEPDNTEYWSSFVAYTAKHIEELNNSLIMCINRCIMTLAREESPLDLSAATNLAVMECVALFLRGFYENLSLPEDLCEEAVNASWKPRFIAALDSEYAAPEGIADIFIDAAREAIRNKLVPVYAMARCFSEKPTAAIYYNDDYVFFDRKAFQIICGNTGLNLRKVVRDLAAQGYLYSKRTNDDSFQRQIRIKGLKPFNAYCVNRELFEQLGEPSLFQGVV